MKRFPRKTLVLLIAGALLLTIAVGSTVAFLVAATEPVTNAFTPAQVDTKIVETMAKGSKSSIKVYNKDDVRNVPAYVRVAIVGNWVDKDGNIVALWDGSVDHTSDWTYSGGYYYYNSPLDVNKYTNELLKSAITDGTAPVEGARLVVTVLHQAIQAAGWPEGVDNAQEAFQEAAKPVK